MAWYIQFVNFKLQVLRSISKITNKKIYVFILIINAFFMQIYIELYDEWGVLKKCVKYLFEFKKL